MDTPALNITFTQVPRFLPNWYSIHPSGHWTMSGDMLGYPNTGGGAMYVTGISWVESSDAGNHLAVPSKPLTAKNYPVESVNSSENEKHCSPFAFLISC